MIVCSCLMLCWLSCLLLTNTLCVLVMLVWASELDVWCSVVLVLYCCYEFVVMFCCFAGLMIVFSDLVSYNVIVIII